MNILEFVKGINKKIIGEALFAKSILEYIDSACKSKIIENENLACSSLRSLYH